MTYERLGNGVVRFMKSLAVAVSVFVGVGSGVASGHTWVEDTKRKAEQGDPVAQYQLGLYFRREYGDYENAIKWFTLSANQGYVIAQHLLGGIYEKGQGVPQDYIEAAKWYQLAADHGFMIAQDNLGQMYQFGRGVPQDISKAIKWYKLASENGNYFSSWTLGTIYSIGGSVPKNEAEAAKWFLVGAEQGDSTSQFAIAQYYRLGLGVPVDYQEAMKWYEESSDRIPDSHFWIGYLHYTGQVFPSYFYEGSRRFQLAANECNSNGAYWLGITYKDGLGNQKDTEKAHMWMSVGMFELDYLDKSFKEDSEKFLQELEDDMSKYEIRKSQQRARRFYEENCAE